MRKALRTYCLFTASLVVSLAFVLTGTAQPTFTSTPVTTATVGSPYTYAISATDPSNVVLNFTGVNVPSWLTLNSNGQSSASQFGGTVSQPGGIAGDPAGNIYVSNLTGTGVYKIAPDGTTTLWHTRSPGYVYAMYVYNGFLYISYYSNDIVGRSCITKVNLASPGSESTVYTAASTYVYLSMTYHSNYLYIAAYGLSKVLKLHVTTNVLSDVVNVGSPFGLGFNSAGLLYIASYNSGSLYTYNLTTSTLTQVLTGLGNPSDVKIDAYDNVYISGYQYVKKYTPNLSSFIQVYNAPSYVWGMSITPTGALVFGDNGGNKVAKLQTGASLTGTPALAHLGNNPVTVRVSNGTATADQSFNIAVYAAPTIGTMSNLTKNFGEPDFTITNPTSNSPGAFSYGSSNTNVATVSGNTVTLTGTGTTTITATQAASGFYNSGTRTFILTVNTAPAAGALHFDGTGDYFPVGNINTPASYTKEAWVYANSTSTVGRNIISSNDAPFWIENGRLSAAHGFTSGAVILQDPSASFPLNQWVHVAVTYDAATTTMKLYRNGTLINSSTSMPAHAPAPMLVGLYDAINFFSGSMDEVRIWNRALCADEINNNRNCELPNPTTQTGLAAYYKFNQGNVGVSNTSIINAQDSGPNNLTASSTLNGFAKTGTSSNFVAGTVSGTCPAYTVTTAAITGTAAVCVNATSQLNNTVSGGTWSSSNATVASINASGLVTALSTGTSQIKYTTLCGGVSTLTVTVNPKPAPTIYASTPTTFCAGGSVELKVSALGNAMSMNGSGYAQSTNAALPQGNGSRTMEAWVKTTASTTGVILNWGRVFSNQRSGILVANGHIYYVGEYNDLEGSINVNDGNWHHLAATFDGTTLRLYVDGVMDISSARSFATNGTTLRIGQRSPGDGGNELYNGIVDEIRVWNVARTQAELQNNRFAEIPGTSSGLVAYYKLNESSGTTLADASANNVTSNLTSSSVATWIPSNAPGSYTSYAWSPGGATTSTITAGTTNNYTVTVTNTSGCTATSAPVSVTATPNNTITLSSAAGTNAQAKCINTAISNITYSTTGATGATFSGLPTGITGSWSNNVATISGTPSVTGIFSYTVTLTGGCGTVTTTGSIVANPAPVAAITAQSATTFCTDGSVTLKSTGSSLGNALNFNGSNQYVTVNNTSTINNLGLTGYTLEAWVYPTSVSGVKSILRKTSDYNLYIIDGSVAAEVWPMGSGNTTWIKALPVTANILTTNTWAHIAATWNKTTGTFKLYINGTEVAATITNGNIGGSEPLNIGYSQQYFQPFAGKLDEVRIWNTPRTETQIANSRNSFIASNTPNFVAYYKFDEASGTTTADATGNGNNGTLVNGPTRVIPSDVPVTYTNYTWTPGNATTSSINVTASGNYTLTVADVNGCTATSSPIAVTVNPLPTATVSKTDVNCPSSGSITVTATSGTAPYQYSINGGGSYQSSNIFNGLSAVTYLVYIKDATGCSNAVGNVTLTTVTPEINLTGNGNNIVHGDVSPSAADNTDFGGTTPGTAIAKTFIIQNTGNTALNISSIGVSGPDAAAFAVSGISFPATVAAGGTASFVVNFNTATVGVKTATVTVNSNDCDEATYSVTLRGEATCTAPSFANGNPYIQGSTANNSCDAVITYALSASGVPAPNVSYVFSGATTATGTGTGSGQAFNKGVTHVVVTATNACGAPTTSFDITVVDNVKPVVITKNITLYLNASGQATLNPADLDNGSSDNCSAVTFSSSNSGTICASAAEGNSLTLSAPAGKVITSIDFASYGTPGGSCGNFTTGWCHSPSSMSAFAGAIGQNSFTIQATNTIFGDPCGGTVKWLYVQATYGFSSAGSNVFGCNNIGANTVELTVSDVDGNSATGTAIVTVLDAIKPTVVTRNLTLCLDASGNATITAGQINNGSTDNCTAAGSMTYSLDQTSFNSSHVGANTVTLSVRDASGNIGTATATVTINALPEQYAVTGGGEYCVGTTGVPVGLYSSQTGVNYQLKRNGTNVGSVVPGTGSALNFGVQTVAGTYTVVATNASTSCTSNMSGNAVVAVNAKPVITIAPSTTSVCVGGSVTLTASQNITTTRTYNVPAADLLGVPNNCNNTGFYGWGTPMGIRWTDIGTGTVSNVKIELSVGVECHGTAARTTTFNSGAGPAFTPTASSCSCPSTTKLTTINFTPSNYVINGVNTFLVNNTTNFGFIQNAALGNYYAVVTVTYSGGSSAAMSNWVWSHDGATTPGISVTPAATTTYTVTGTDINGCTNTASSTVTVNPLPNIYNMTGGGISGGNPVAIGLSGSESGVRYQLMRGTTVVGTPVNGNGGAISFASQTTAGFYSAVATNSSTNCTSNMNGAVEVIAGIAPTFSNTQSALQANTPANACAVAVAYGLSATGIPAPALSYVFTGATTGSGTGTGSGNTFNKGTTYVTVTATNFVGTATYNFTVTVIDNVDPIITAPAAISVQADAGQCGATVDLGAPTVSDNCGVAGTTNNSASFLVNGRFPVGTTTVTWTVTDNSGLTSTATQVVTVTDVEDPVITAPAAISVNNDAGKCGAAIIITAPAATDNCAVAGVVGVRSDALALTADYPVGTTIITWTATDVHNRTSTVIQTVTVTDNEKPVISATTAISVNNDAGLCTAVVTINTPYVTDNCEVSSVTGVRSDALALTAPYPVGTTTITWTAVDIHNNTEVSTQTITVTDNQKPVITNMPADIVTYSIPNNCLTMVGWAKPKAADNCGVASLVSNDLNFEAFGFTLLSVGVHTITYTATDIHGNPTTASFTITVLDNQPPVITGCPADITVNAATGRCDAIVNWNPPFVGDNCSALGVSVTTTHIQGSVFPVGTTAVTYTAIDHAGNRTTCTFNVTVVDAEKPTISIPAITVSNDAGACGAVVNPGTPVTADNCGVTPATHDGSANGFYPVGTTTVTWTVKDIHGNEQTATQLITVNDTEKPVVQVQHITVQLGANGTAVITPAQVNNGSADNCGIAGLVLSKTNFDCSNIGTNMVTLTVTDIHGNTNVANAIVTVKDEVPATVITRNITVQLNASGTASIVAADVDNGSNDACGIASLSVSPNAFTCANVGANTVTLTVTDVNGNVSSATAVVTVEDKVPAVVITKNITIQLNASGTASIVAADVDNGSNDACGIASLSVAPNAFTCANLGTNTVTLTVTDVNGNVSSDTAVVTVEDKVPAVVITKNITVQLNASGTASIVAADVDNGSNDACGIASLSVSPNAFTCANVGANTVTLTVTDVNGNVSSATAVVTVEDKVPAVVITSNITVQLNASGTASIVAADVDNGSNDACGIASLSVSPNAFTCANVGANTVTLTVTDVNGNVSSATAVVTVEDKVPAVVITKNITVQLNASGTASIVAADVDNGSNDACGIASLSVSPNAFTCANVGANTVTLTVTDVNGNVSSATAVVTVEDKVPAVVITKNITIQLNASGTASIVAADVDNGSNDACGIASLSVSPNTFTCENVGANTVTLTVTDVNGNVSSATAIVTVKDEVAPVAVTKNITIALNPAGTVSITGDDVNNGSADACGIASLAVYPNTFTCANLGLNTVTLTVTDVNGNTSTQLATVTIKDETAPVASLEALPVVTGQCAATVTGTPTAADACSGLITGTTTDPLTYTAQGTYTITWKYTDVFGNSSYQQQTVIVKDNIAPVPVLAALPTVTAECSAGVVIRSASPCTDDCNCCRNGCHCRTSNCKCRDYDYRFRGVVSYLFNLWSNYFNWDDEDHECDHDTVQDQVMTTMTAPTATDNCKGTIVATTTDPLVYTTQGTHIIHWVFNDGNGNITVQEQTIIVKDNTAPIANDHKLPTLSGFCSVTVSGKPTAKDNCVGTVTGTTTDPLVYTAPGTYTINWIYSDGHGNSSTQTQTVIVKDPVPPVPTTGHLPTVTGNCSVTVTTVPTAKDNCDGILTGTTTDPLTYTKAGTYTIRWTYTDGRNIITQNQTVIVKDNIDPVLQVSALPVISGNCSVTVTTIPKATDNCAGVITATTNNPLTYTAKGTYTIVWKYDDGNGNTVTQNQTVVVSDATAPVISAPAAVTVNCGTSTAPATTGTATATDNCGTAVVTYSDLTTLTKITRTWKATDASGNSSTAVQIINIVDNTAPVVTVPAAVNVNCGASTSPSATGNATATDNCGTPSLTYSDVKTGNVITRTWKATDAFGNTGTAAQAITIVDNTRPVVKCPANTTISCGAPTAPNNCGGYATATDNCDASPAISYLDAVNGNTITRTWTATDDAGNTSSCTQTITMVDNTKPVLTEPNDITVNCNSSTLPAVTGMATATDNCSTPVITYLDAINGNTITRTWKATDASGNYITDVQKITIGTAFSPAITSVPTNNTYTGGVATNLYLGYGAQSTKLEVCALPSSGAPYTYTWSGSAVNRISNTSGSAPVFTPTVSGSYTFVVTVTNKFGCTLTDNITICVTDIRVPGTNGTKVYVCHKTSSWKKTYETLQVSVNSVSAHLNHGCGNNDDDDRLGSCDQAPCNTTNVMASANSNTQTVTSETASVVKATSTEEDLKITVMPNPTTTFFTLKLESRNQLPVDLRVMDAAGRVVDSKSKLGANSSLQVGHNYSSGTYYAEFVQGGKRKVLQLIKAK
jgi:hypothetical protein